MNIKPFYYLKDIEDVKRVSARRSEGKCPVCGSSRGLVINTKTGLFNCFACGNFHGIFYDFWDERMKKAMERRMTQKDISRSHPEDYEPLAKELLRNIRPLLAGRGEMNEERRAVEEYLMAQKLSMQTAEKLGLCYGKAPFQLPKSESGRAVKDEKGHAVMETRLLPCLCYPARINGLICNVKMRAVALKTFRQISEKGDEVRCPPFNIDSINPLLYDEDRIAQLIVTEGEKDVCSLVEAGFRFAISVPNGCSADAKKVFAPFEEWLEEVDEVVICGDADVPGRKMIAALADYFKEKARIVNMPMGCKDISDALQKYGPETVRQVIRNSKSLVADTIVEAHNHLDGIFRYLENDYDHGRSIGYGPATDVIFKHTEAGGLILGTGMPNSGKTDFINDLMTHLMATLDLYVAFLSFEVVNKEYHMGQLVKLLTGCEDLSCYSREELMPYVNFIDSHMCHIVLGEQAATPDSILASANAILQRHPLKYLVIDPFLFLEPNHRTKEETETQSVKSMLTALQRWGRVHHVWVLLVHHPTKLQKDASGHMESITMYSLSGSAHFANLADYLFSVDRIRSELGEYKVIEMLKVRDQQTSLLGRVCFHRQACGRYDERATEEDAKAELLGAVYPEKKGTII